MDKLIINAAITGMIPTKEMNAAVPVSVAEIAAEVRRCRDAGASIVHVHARDQQGAPTYKKEWFARIYHEIRKAAPDILISGSTSGRNFKEFWQRSEALEPEPGLTPDLGSLTLGSLNFPTGASVNAPEMIKQLAGAMAARNIVPEWELFDLGMIDYAHFLIDKSVLQPPFYCNLFLGSLGTIAAKPENLVAMVKALPRDTTWAATGIGRYQFFINSIAVTMGGHVRVGLEDNLFYDDKKAQPATNAGLIERVVRLAHAAGRDIASPGEAREIIGMPSRCTDESRACSL